MLGDGTSIDSGRCALRVASIARVDGLRLEAGRWGSWGRMTRSVVRRSWEGKLDFARSCALCKPRGTTS